MLMVPDLGVRGRAKPSHLQHTVCKAKVRNVKVISSEECVPKHKLLVMDMQFKAKEMASDV